MRLLQVALWRGGKVHGEPEILQKGRRGHAPWITVVRLLEQLSACQRDVI